MSIFNDGSKYYPQVFLDNCLYKLAVQGINVDFNQKYEMVVMIMTQKSMSFNDFQFLLLGEVIIELAFSSWLRTRL